MLTLLEAFDAMRMFLEWIWRRDDMQSDDLADLLSSTNRDIVSNGPPLDTAQWADWLDATLSIKPDWDEVVTARRNMTAEQGELLLILEVEPIERRKVMLDAYNAKKMRQLGTRLVTCASPLWKATK